MELESEPPRKQLRPSPQGEKKLRMCLGVHRGSRRPPEGKHIVQGSMASGKTEKMLTLPTMTRSLDFMPSAEGGHGRAFKHRNHSLIF